MFAIALRESLRARTMPRRSPLTKVTLALSIATSVPVPVPRTAVPLGIDDPVERARAELKAALAAIEVKANVPRRVAQATERAGLPDSTEDKGWASAVAALDAALALRQVRALDPTR